MKSNSYRRDLTSDLMWPVFITLLTAESSIKMEAQVGFELSVQIVNTGGKTWDKAQQISTPEYRM